MITDVTKKEKTTHLRGMDCNRACELTAGKPTPAGGKHYIFIIILSIILTSCKEVKVGTPIIRRDLIDLYVIEVELNNKFLSQAVSAFRDSLEASYSCSQFNYIMVRAEIVKDTSEFYLFNVSPGTLSIFAADRDTFYVTNYDSTLILIMGGGPFSEEKVQTLPVNFNLSKCENYLRKEKCYLFSADFRMTIVKDEIDSIEYKTDCMILSDEINK